MPLDSQDLHPLEKESCKDRDASIRIQGASD